MRHLAVTTGSASWPVAEWRKTLPTVKDACLMWTPSGFSAEISPDILRSERSEFA